MNRAVYDSRFFSTLYYSEDKKLRESIRREKSRRGRFVSAVVIHEIYRLVLTREGRETAKLQIAFIKQDFEVVPVDDQIAQVSAELRQKYNLSMGDSMVAATACALNAVCVSDDPHFKQIREIQTTWV
jgi:predicted nucleic acid-binding protein